MEKSKIPFTLEQVREELARRNCKPNQFTGVTPLSLKINDRYRLVVPKLLPLFTIAGISDHKDLTDGIDYILIRGGRGGTKSESIAHALIEIAEKENDVECLCTREIQDSIQESVYSYLENWINFLGYSDHYKFTQNMIVNTNTGFAFRFKGLTGSTKTESLKALAKVKYVWCEEARTLSAKSIRMLLPSVRIDGRKLIFSYNNGRETDPIEKLKRYEESMCIDVNIFDNPFCPEVLWKQCQADKVIDLNDYLHVWEGHYITDNPDKVILPFKWLEKCLNAHKTTGYEPIGKTYAGLDVAEGETIKHDKNSIVIRQANVAKYHNSWQCKNIYESVSVVKSEYYDYGFESVYFDGIGIGSGYSSEVARIDNVEKEKLPFNNICFKGSNSVYGADTVYTRHGTKIVTNADFFKNAKTQQWWNLRLMAQNTIKLLDGKKIDREDYFLSFEGD